MPRDQRCPHRFIEEPGKSGDETRKEIIIDKKPLFIQLEFEGDDVTVTINSIKNTDQSVSCSQADYLFVYLF